VKGVVSNKIVLIVGAGPAGLAIGARLERASIPYRILESSNEIAPKWLEYYDRLHLHTSKKNSHLPFAPFPKHFPTFISKTLFYDYLHSYALEHSLKIEFNANVEELEKVKNGYQLIVNGESRECKSVVIATGLNNQPLLPFWAKDSKIPLIHAKEYRNPSQFKIKSAIVVGFGNSGAEIALDLAENGIQTFCSIRNEVNIIPLKVNGKPTQEAGKLLEYLPFNWGDKIGKWISRRIIGDLSSYGIKISSMTPAEQLKKTGRTPVMDLGTIEMIKDGNISVKPDISRVDHKIYFTDDTELEVDQIICATGYGNGLGTLLGSVSKYLDESGDPPMVGQGQLQGLYFLGFNNHTLGGVLSNIRENSDLISKEIEQQFRSLDD